VGASTFATGASIRELAREERRATKLARKQLEEALADLPEPQFDYELETPMDMDDEDESRVLTIREEDAADIDAAERRRLQAEADKLYEARSSVVKRSELPRPVGAIPETKFLTESDAEQLIDAERWTLLRHDAHAFPVEALPSLTAEKKKKKKKNSKQAPLPPETPLDYIPEEKLNAAKEDIQAEMSRLLEEKAQPLLANGNSMEKAMEYLNEEILSASKKSLSSQEVYITEKGWANQSKKTLMQSYASEFDAIQDATSALHKKNEKVESKVAVLIGGYSKRAEAIASEMFQTYGDLRNSMIEEAVYSDLQSKEEKGSVARIDRLRSGIQKLQTCINEMSSSMSQS
jgi:hypothetical protein